MTEIKFPHVTVEFPDLSGPGGNAFVLIGNVAAAIRKLEGPEASNAFADEAMSQDSYEGLLAFIKRTVNVI